MHKGAVLATWFQKTFMSAPRPPDLKIKVRVPHTMAMHFRAPVWVGSRRRIFFDFSTGRAPTLRTWVRQRGRFAPPTRFLAFFLPHRFHSTVHRFEVIPDSFLAQFEVIFPVAPSKQREFWARSIFSANFGSEPKFRTGTYKGHVTLKMS